MAKKNVQAVKKAETANGKAQKKLAAGPITTNPKKNFNASQKMPTPNKAGIGKRPNSKEIQQHNSSSDEEDDEETNQQTGEEQSDDGSDIEESGNGVNEDDSSEGDEEEEDGGDSDEEDEDDDEEDEDDEAPAEEPIAKVKTEAPKNAAQKKNAGGNNLPPIKTIIPKAYDQEAIVKVSNVPQKYKPTDVVEAFLSFGKVAYIQRIANQFILVAFENAEQAKAAIAANGTVFIAGNKVQIKAKATPTPKKKPQEDEFLKRSIIVRNLPRNITEQGISEHLASCGEIEHIKHNPKLYFAIVRFSDASAIDEALKLHNSQINGEYILVAKHRIFPNNDEKKLEDKRKVILMNTKDQKTVSPEELKKVFKKCGEIERIDIYCKKVLAFIVFAKEESVPKALQLNGKTIDGLQIKVEECKKNHRSPTVFLQNLNKTSSDETIKEFFSSCGSIKRFIRHPQSSTAIVEFDDLDGYCKAFLLDSETLDFNRIFVEPFSIFKQRLLSKKGPAKPNPNAAKRKTPFPQGPKKFNNAKKAKVEN